jgi:plasmid replication initiation protein
MRKLGEKDRMRGIKDVVTMTYVLEALKELLGIGDKYKSEDLKGFRDYVLNKIRDEINKNSPSMSVEYNYLKKQRKVTGVTFDVSDKQQAAKQLQTLPLHRTYTNFNICCLLPAS